MIKAIRFAPVGRERDPESGAGLPADWRVRLARELESVARAGRWDLALMAIGVWHLCVFLALHRLYLRGDEAPWKHIGLWSVDMLGALGWMRIFSGPGWIRSTPLAGLLVRVWGTFCILAFNLATLNTLTGHVPNWYKLGWGVLSTFGFMMMTFLLSPWFFLAAVWMFLMDLALAVTPKAQFLIYGGAWCLCLWAIALTLRARWAGAAAT